MDQNIKDRDARHRKERKARNKHNWGIPLVPSWLFAEDKGESNKLTLPIISPTMPSTTDSFGFQGVSGDVLKELVSSPPDKGKSIDLMNVIPTKDKDRLKSELFPEWVEYEKLWDTIKAVQHRRSKMRELSKNEQKSLMQSTQEHRLGLQMLDIKQARRIEDIQDKRAMYETVIQNETEHTPDEFSSVDKARTLVLGERARAVDIDLEWDKDSAAVEDEVAVENANGTVSNLPAIIPAKQMLQARLNFEFVLYTNNQRLMHNFALNANLDDGEVDAWVGETQNRTYFQDHDCSFEQAIKVNDAYIRTQIEKAYERERESARKGYHAKAFGIVDDCEAFYMHKTTAALGKDKNCFLDDVGEINIPAPQQTLDYKGMKRSLVEKEKVEALLIEIDATPKLTPTSYVSEADNRKEFCIVCGQVDCGIECWGRKRKVAQPKIDPNFFVRDSMISSKGEKISDICTSCGQIGCGLFCDNPSPPDLSKLLDSIPPTYSTAQSGINGVGSRYEIFCIHCKKEGHEKYYCWKLHPELIPAKFEKPCGICGRRFHTEKTCFHAKRTMPQSSIKKTSVPKQPIKSEWAKTFDRIWGPSSL